MVSRKKRSGFFIRNNKGFSLIEIAVVLVIIGIIIGAIVKGKDIMKSAEQKKVYTKFVNAWQLSYMTFYDRTGKILGDTWDSVIAVPAAGQDGQADTAAGAAGVVTDAGRADLYDGPAAGSDYMGLLQAGISAPSTNTTNNYEYRYTDSDGAGHDLSVAFEYDDTDKCNYMWVINCPNELGIALDTMVDGEADGTAGDFLCFLNDGSGSATAWAAVVGATLPTDEVSFRWKLQF
jgi:prepilin-type N-terminal cleavage/methylation domain-containing protein